MSRLGAILAVCLLKGAVPSYAQAAERPNVVLIITDDQGYGDIAAHGNAMIKTPHLDRLHGESVRLTDFHVDPTCSPTRSALLTGRYSTRTGVWHTIQGRSLMSTQELTLAEILQAAGYRTGMFGKWHLGDNFPCRPQDQGFERTWHHGGGGVTQTPDWWGNDYFDDTYVNERGEPHKFTGYCTDVWFDTALEFIDGVRQDDAPFFCYLATNAPHGPYLVDERYSQPYVDAGVPQPMANFYGMITNIDENVGRLRARLAAWGLDENTILIFMTDNGTAAGVPREASGGGRRVDELNSESVDEPIRRLADQHINSSTNQLRNSPDASGAWPGFNDGMRGRKGSEYDGGHRVPFFISWPAGGLTGGRDSDQLTAHIDVLPTLLDLCEVQKPDGPPLDGASLASVLSGDGDALRDRTLFVHSQRLEHVVKWRKCAVMTERWRFVNGEELYDIQSDPGQTSDVATAHPQVVDRLTAAYDDWWDSLSPVFDEYVRISLGADQENPAQLTCHDWHTDGEAGPWNHEIVSKDPAYNGYWAVNVETPGTYEFRLRTRPAVAGALIPAGTARLRMGDVDQTVSLDGNSTVARITTDLKPGPQQLQTWFTATDGTQRGAYFAEVERLE